MIRSSYIESVRRFWRNWRRKINRILPTALPAPFFHAKDIHAVHEYFSAFETEQQSSPPYPASLAGTCYICNKEVDFSVNVPADGSPVNWRETLTCPDCGLINRWRSCLHVFDAICEPTTDDRIYLTETLSPIYQNLAGRYPMLTSSEYFPDFTFGELVEKHATLIRNEDITKLTFANASLESILCFDVLEHIPDYHSALKEFYRVLGSGGQVVISVPFSFQQKTLVRATLDSEGEIRHLVEPCYHGDPLSPHGVLSYYDFGMELLEELRGAGFQECFLLCYYSQSWGYSNGNVVFVARKLKTSVDKREILKSIWERMYSQARNLSQKISVVFKSAHKQVALPEESLSEYEKKLQNEQSFYKDYLNVHDLPDIFHYWSNKYLAPEMERFGFTNPDDFFVYYIKEYLSNPNRGDSRILSIGSGNCDRELSVCKKLVSRGYGDFTFECLDINKDMLDRGSDAANNAGLADHFLFTRGDFNKWSPTTSYGIVICNQSLHHVLNLEDLFDSVKRSLEPGGLFLISDMIGRNGHMRWPEAMERLEPFWDELPESYRYNQLMKRHEQQYINHDCSTEGFEGIRAQDILPLLLERFNFDFFFPFGNMVFVFIDRPFGHNFDADADWDRDFIDRVHAKDEEYFISGELKPTSMLAVLTCSESATVLRHPILTPQHCVRPPNQIVEGTAKQNSDEKD